MSVDFHQIDASHAVIHGRLENWALSCYGTSGSSAAPMFRLYRPDHHWEGQEPSIPIDRVDAHKIAKGVIALPTPHRLAINWCYVKRTNPKRACQEIGTSREGLAMYIRDGRQMLINRKV